MHVRNTVRIAAGSDDMNEPTRTTVQAGAKGRLLITALPFLRIDLNFKEFDIEI
jgi:hypothetical protein